MAGETRTPEERLHMIREAGCFIDVARGHVHGHDPQARLAVQAALDGEPFAEPRTKYVRP